MVTFELTAGRCNSSDNSKIWQMWGSRKIGHNLDPPTTSSYHTVYMSEPFVLATYSRVSETEICSKEMWLSVSVQRFCVHAKCICVNMWFKCKRMAIGSVNISAHRFLKSSSMSSKITTCQIRRSSQFVMEQWRISRGFLTRVVHPRRIADSRRNLKPYFVSLLRWQLVTVDPTLVVFANHTNQPTFSNKAQEWPCFWS